jgi:hypothetical protein
LIGNIPGIGNNQINIDKYKLLQNLPDSKDKDNRFSETDIEAKEYILTELEYLVYKSSTRVAAQITKRACRKARTFQKGWLIILAIPSKLYIYTKPKYYTQTG